MRITIYPCTPALFGRVSQSWARQLAAMGHDVALSLTPRDQPLRIVPADLNLFIAGVFLLESIGRFGFPRGGRNVLWMFDPLTDDPAAVDHVAKAAVLERIACGLHGVIGMNRLITNWVNEHLPGIPTREIPYTVDQHYLRPPLPEDASARIDVLHLGRESERRRRVEEMFRQRRVPALFVYAGKYGPDRHDLIASARINLKTHRDAHAYFDQFRIFEAWANGSAVVAEPSGPNDSPSLYGVEAGRHLVEAGFEQLPWACGELLTDVPRRRRMVEEAQTLLRERYRPECWLRNMSAALDAMMST